MRVMVLVMRCLMCTDCYLSWHGKDSNRTELLRFWGVSYILSREVLSSSFIFLITPPPRCPWD
jgi:hypothetical protein